MARRGPVRRGWLPAVGALLLQVLTGAVPASAGSTGAAGFPLTLPLSGFYDLEVDGERDTILVSEGPGGDAVAMVDYAGNLLGTLDVAGPSGMQIVGDTLYVASFDAGRIDAFDLTTDPPMELGGLDLSPDYPNPAELEHAGGRLWFTDGYCQTHDNRLIGVDLDGTPDFVEITEDEATSWSYCPHLGAGPEAPNRLFVWKAASVPSRTFVYDVSGTTPVRTSYRPSFGGSEVEPLSATTFATAIDPLDLGSGLGVFPSDTTGDASFEYQSGRTLGGGVEHTSLDGGMIAAAAQNTGAVEYWVWKVGAAAPFRTFDLAVSASIGTPRARGLAFTDDGEYLMTVTGLGSSVILRQFDLTPPCPGYETSSLNQIVGTVGQDTLNGTAARDVICGLGGNDTIAGLGGNDILLGGDGADAVVGGNGADLIDLGPGDDSSSTAFGSKGGGGGAGNDTIIGGDGDYDLFGWGGNDILNGGNGGDVLFGDAGNDTLNGGNANDVMAGFGGADVNNGGVGFDCADFEFDTGPVVANLSTGQASGLGVGSDTLTQTECLLGTAKGDTLTGSAGGNTLWGLNGNDRLYGLAGNDYLHGWAGYDTLDCGTGTDLGIVGAGGGSRAGCEYTSLSRELAAVDPAASMRFPGPEGWGRVAGSRP